MYRLINPTRRYDWGSTSLIQDLCGLGRDGQRAAEMWMGAHSDDPSRIILNGQEIGLDSVILQDPGQMLGSYVLTQFGPRLPFLVKFLAAEHPLSLQVHPNTRQAQVGFATETSEGISLSASGRNYRDQMHKPELIYALTPFELMTGLRHPAVSAELVDTLNVPSLNDISAILTDKSLGQPHREVFNKLLSDRGNTPDWIEDAASSAAKFNPEEHPEYALVSELATLFPGDPGLIAPLLLNFHRLAAGEALFTPAGTLHSYVRGLGVEVMASSDNVLRAGLTSKVVDSVELMRIAHFSAAPAVAMTPDNGSFVPPVPEFTLTVVEVRPAEHFSAPTIGPRLTACVKGTVILQTAFEQLVLTSGESAFVPDHDGALTISGNGTALVTHV